MGGIKKHVMVALAISLIAVAPVYYLMGPYGQAAFAAEAP